MYTKEVLARIRANCEAGRCSAVTVVCLALILCARAGAQQTNERPAAVDQSPSPLKVASNIVVVRVVVRDAQGNPVEGLKKEDFKIFDRGKEQTITQFEVESALAPSPNSAPPDAPGQARSTAPAAPSTTARRQDSWHSTSTI